MFSLALVRGDAGKRRWRVYAHARLENREGVNITVPEFGKTAVNVPRADAFHLIGDADQTTTPVSAAL